MEGGALGVVLGQRQRPGEAVDSLLVLLAALGLVALELEDRGLLGMRREVPVRGFWQAVQVLRGGRPCAPSLRNVAAGSVVSALLAPEPSGLCSTFRENRLLT